MTQVTIASNVPVKLSFSGAAPTTLPATQSVTVLATDGASRRLPCFWDGKTWNTRISSPTHGTFSVTPDWPDATPSDARITVVPNEGKNIVYRRGGPVRLGSRLAYANDTPFLWLGDTWWYGLGNRISDREFRDLAARRAEQGFSVVQIVAGLHVDIGPFHPIGNSDAGWPWTQDFAAINPQWWDDADQRIEALVEAGLVPCIVGAWGYYLQFMTDAQMQEHWRNIVARWGAYPVVFCLAGEVTMPFYSRPVTPASEASAKELSSRWTGLLRYVRAIDAHSRPLTAHPAPAASHYSTIDSLHGVSGEEFDLNVLQTGHSDQHSLPLTFEVLHRELARPDGHPVMNIEVNYEGIGSGSFHPMQRFLWWSHMLSGSAGFTYGAQGLWGMEDETYAGLTGSWGEVGWREAAKLPGADHLGRGRRFLEEIAWEELRPAPLHIATKNVLTDRLAPSLPPSEIAIFSPTCLRSR